MSVTLPISRLVSRASLGVMPGIGHSSKSMDKKVIYSKSNTKSNPLVFYSMGVVTIVFISHNHFTINLIFIDILII